MSTITARLSAIEETLAILVAAQTAKAAPAKVTTRKAPAKKAAPRKAAKVVPATKGTQSRETLSRKDWNRTLTAKARLAGKIQGTEKSVYADLLDNWASAQAARDAGYTPDQFLAVLLDEFTYGA